MKSLSVFEITRNIFHFILIVDIGIGTFNFNKLIDDQKTVYYLLICTALVEIVTVSLWRFKKNNNFVYHFYSVIEFLLLGSLYVRHLKRWIKTIYLRGVIASFVLFAMMNTVFFQSLLQFNTNVTVVESLLLILFATLFGYRLLHIPQQHVTQSPMFWINASVLTYFSGAFLLFNVVNDLFPKPFQEHQILWITHGVFNIAHYFLYGVALCIRPAKSIDPNLS